MSRSLAAVSFVLLVVPLNLFAQRNPTVSSAFALTAGGVVTAQFRSCSGLAANTDVIEYRQGSDTGGTIIQKIPGLTKYSNITLKRGISGDQSLALWFKMVADGQITQARKNGTIALLDSAGRPIASWAITNAWPCGLAIETDPETGDTMEVLTLAVESIRRQ